MDQAIKQVFAKDWLINWLKLAHKGGDKVRNILGVGITLRVVIS